MANHFNIFFTSVSSAIVNEINPSDHPPDALLSKDDIHLISLSDSPLTATEIIEATNLLQGKKTLDLFRISVWLTQKIITNISAPLKHIFATSFSLGIVPSQK